MGETGETKRPCIDASVHLDAIRGIAAVWVLLAHVRVLFMTGGLTALIAGHAVASRADSSSEPIAISHFRFASLLGGHAIGSRMAVMAFFVLSGYLVGGSALNASRKNAFSWNRYLFQRLTRLWIVLIPALFLCLAFDACGIHLLKSPLYLMAGSQGGHPISSQFTFGAFVGSALFLQGIFTSCFGSNGPLWSLSYEFWYYIFFPLLIAVLSRSKQTSVRVKIGLLLALLLAMSGWKIGAYFLIWLMGAGVACLPLRLPRRMRGISTAVAGFILVAAMTLALRLPINLFFAEFAIGAAFSLFLWVVLHAQEVSVHPLYRTSAQTLSGMSYTLYLSHYPMLLLLSALILPTRQLWAVSAFSLLKVVSILSIVFAASWLVYYCFERNTPAIRNWLRMQLEVRRAHVAR